MPPKNNLILFIKLITPPIFIAALRKLFRRDSIKFVTQPTWEIAIQNSEGYDSESLIEKTKKSAMQVAKGLANYERDSVVFDEIHYSFPLLASLLFVAANNNSLRVIDFGGSFGTTLQQNRKFFSNLRIKYDWRIVEQPLIVEIGQKEFSGNQLNFYTSIDEAVKDGFDVIVFSGSLCYVSDPYSYLDKAISVNSQYIVFDRTPIQKGVCDTFAIQYTPASIYKASYPIRNFSHKILTEKLNSHYDLVEEWKCDLQPDINTVSMGFLFKLKSPLTHNP